MTQLHDIREAHAKELEATPEREQTRHMPFACPHCGGAFPVKSDDDPEPGYKIIGVIWGKSRYDTKTRLESPPCPNCGKSTVFEY